MSVRPRKGAPRGAPFLYPAAVTLRIGVIGTGFAGAMHARSARDLDGVTVPAIAGAPPEEAARVAEECHARVGPDPYASCAAGDVDLVVVASPTHLHTRQPLARATAGR